ncbi:MAG: hypothetical protein ACTSWZ_05825 [Candidatus Heimdallarchaeaceae archaeon]
MMESRRKINELINEIWSLRLAIEKNNKLLEELLSIIKERSEFQRTLLEF